MYVVVFFLLLWVLFQMVLCECETRCREDILYILQTEDENNIKETKKFEAYLEGYRNNVKIPTTEIININSASLEETLQEMDTKDLKYVINLHVEDFYKYNHHDVLRRGLAWAGDIGEGKTQDVCRSHPTVRKNGMETCTQSTEVLKHVKLVSTAVMCIDFLYNATINFQFKDKSLALPVPSPVKYYIYVCTESFKRVSNYDKTLKLANGIKIIKYRSVNDCQYINNLDKEVIAIIAHSPKWIQETNKPVLFYEEPYSLSENTSFYQNSISRERSMEPLADAFIQYMRLNNWRRIAILSDDAIESDNFEQHLRKLLERDGVIYTVIKVRETDKRYNFSKALRFLKTTDVKIIITNVDKKHAESLGMEANAQKITISEGIQWIARDWSKKVSEKAAESLVYVLSVSPRRTPYYQLIRGINRVINNKFCNKYYNYLDHKTFAADIREEIQWVDSKHIEVTETYNGKSHIIAKYMNGLRSYSTPLYLISDRKEKCNLPSANFDKPCDDMNVIFILLVIAVASITVLGITYFFQTPDMLYDRMS